MLKFVFGKKFRTMDVMKFGGTSVGSAQRIKNVALLAEKAGKNIVVLSAMSGTTNSLVEIAERICESDAGAALNIINELEGKYRKHIEELYSSEEYAGLALEYVSGTFDCLRTFTRKPIGPKEEKTILAQGELLSSHMMYWHILEQGKKASLIPALEFMRTDFNGEPDLDYIKLHIRPFINSSADADIIITQGYICRNFYDEIDNLQRGGSDYSATLIGAAVNAGEIQIWTDIDGMHNNDPRVVEGTVPVRHLHFDEAAELGFFGAKILHPTCILPAKAANIPVRLLSTIDPSAPGTLIDGFPDYGKIKAVAAKDNIVAINILSSRTQLPYGFMRKVYEIFESYQVGIDMQCSSETSISVAIGRNPHLDAIVRDLKSYGSVNVCEGMCIICVVGDMEWHNTGFESMAAKALEDIPVRMISYGGSRNNISFLIREEDRIRTLNALNKRLFQ